MRLTAWVTRSLMREREERLSSMHLLAHASASFWRRWMSSGVCFSGSAGIWSWARSLQPMAQRWRRCWKTSSSWEMRFSVWAVLAWHCCTQCWSCSLPEAVSQHLALQRKASLRMGRSFSFSRPLRRPSTAC